VAVAAAVIAVPFLVPVSHLIPEITRFASEKLGQPVTMEDLKLHLVPTPRVVGHRITVGRKGQVLIGELEIEPDLASLIFGPRTVRLIRAQRVVIEESALAMPRGMPKGRPGEPVLVRRLQLMTVKLKHSDLDLPPFHVDVRLGEGFRMLDAQLQAYDGSFNLHAQPSGANTTRLHLVAKRWTLPAGSPLLFDSLTAHGILKAQQLELPQIEGELYGGTLSATAKAEWGKELQLSGWARLAGVDLVPLQDAMGKPPKLSGRLNADAQFSTRATPSGLSDALVVEGPFEVLGGLYRGVDLSRAGELSGDYAAGEATPFEELKGRLELRGERVKLIPLCMRSPSMVAGGNVEIAPDNTLSGRLDLSVAKTGGIFGVPVTLGGTTDDPTMRPSKGYLIGAAIGTVLMPGIGTSIGSALGSRLEGTSRCK
jgi:hypothetical protein